MIICTYHVVVNDVEGDDLGDFVFAYLSKPLPDLKTMSMSYR